MASLISVEPSIFPAIAQYYEDQRTELGAIRSYLGTHCQLNDATGLLLSSLQPQYEEARDSMFDALESIDEAIMNLGIQVAGCEDDYLSDEQSMQDQIDELRKRVEDLENEQAQTPPPIAAPPVAGPPSAPPSGGPPSGGPPSSAPPVAPPPPPMVDPVPPTATDPVVPDTETMAPVLPPTIDIDIEVNGDGNTVEVTIGDGDPVTAVIGDDNTVVIDQELLDKAEADALASADDARHAEFYERMWEERAANDPVGRSADELRLAWEARESIEVPPPAGESALGYGTADLREPLRFEIFLPDASGAVRLEGARS